MSRKSDLAMRQLLCTAAVALAVPTAAGTAHAAPLTGKQSMTGVESKRNSRSRARAEEEAAAAALFPLTLRPVARTTDEETSDAIQVRVEDASGRRVILARAHGGAVVGPLPAGEYNGAPSRPATVPKSMPCCSAPASAVCCATNWAPDHTFAAGREPARVQATAARLPRTHRSQASRLPAMPPAMSAAIGSTLPLKLCPTHRPASAARPICEKPISEAAAPAMRG